MKIRTALDAPGFFCFGPSSAFEQQSKKKIEENETVKETIEEEETIEETDTF